MTFVNVEIPRDRYGRPMVVGLDGGPNRVAYQRATTFVGALENLYNLMAWKQRQTVYGMGQRKDLVLAATAADANDKKKLGEIADKAMEHALSSAAATTGTALHALTERVDRGQPLGPVPDSAEADIRAYENTTKCLENVAIEEFRVYDDWRVAGTADRIVRFQDRLYIADVKTGSIDYPHKIAMQLAMYSHSLPYDIESDTRLHRPEDLSYTSAIIIHLPAGLGECHLHWVDIDKGWRACQLAKQVWDWRKAGGITWPFNADDIKGTPTKTFTMADLAAAADSVEELRVLWKEAHAQGRFDAAFADAVTRRRAELGIAS